MIFDFGKHSGKSVKKVVREDRNYCSWIVKEFNNKNFDDLKAEVEKELSKTGSEPENPNIMPFGKYKGQGLGAFVYGDDDYCEWLLDKDSFKEEYPETYCKLNRLFKLYKDQEEELRYFYILVFEDQGYVKVGITSNFIAKRIYSYSHTNQHIYTDHNIIYDRSYVFMTNDLKIESKVLQHFDGQRIDKRSERLEVLPEQIEEYIKSEQQKHPQFYYRRKCLKDFFPFKDSKTFRDTFYVKINQFHDFRTSYRLCLRDHRLLDQYYPGFQEIKQFQS